MAYRIETGRLDRAERTPQGGLRIPATLARSGVLEYVRPDGSVQREYRPEEEAFHADALASMRGAPVTDLHPESQVTAETYRTVSRGHVGEDPRRDGDLVAATVYVQDAELCRAIEAGTRREVSLGYETDLDMTPGTAPDGTRYDAIQRRVRANHVALGPSGWGRAGSAVALRLDSAGNSVSPSIEIREVRVKTERIDGIEYEVGSAPWEQARARHDAAQVARLAELEQERDRHKATAESEKGRADGLAAELAAAKDPVRLAAAVAARVKLERDAVALRPDLRCDGLSDRAVLLSALGLADEKQSDEYLRGRFDSALAAHGAGGAAAVQMAAHQTQRTDSDPWAVFGPQNPAAPQDGRN